MIFSEQDQEVRDTGYHKHAFNVLISNRLGYHRDLPDTRDRKYARGRVCVCVCVFSNCHHALCVYFWLHEQSVLR